MSKDATQQLLEAEELPKELASQGHLEDQPAKPLSDHCMQPAGVV